MGGVCFDWARLVSSGRGSAPRHKTVKKKNSFSLSEDVLTFHKDPLRQEMVKPNRKFLELKQATFQPVVGDFTSELSLAGDPERPHSSHSSA